jgi:hypothetical protein
VNILHDLGDFDRALGGDAGFALPGQRFTAHLQKNSFVPDIGHIALFLALLYTTF